MSKTFKIGLILTAVAVLVVGTVLARKDGRGEDAWLGIYPETITYRMAKKMDLSEKSGVYVNRVLRDSPAREAGLERGDIILAVDEESVTDSDELSYAILDHEPGDQVTLTISRDGKEMKIKAVLDEAPRRSFSRSFHWGDADDDDGYVFWNDRDLYHKDFERPFLGVSLQDLSRQLGDYFGVERGRGALITEVEEDSPAEKAGLKAGDVIIEIDGDMVRDAEDVIDAVMDRETGDRVNITIKREKNDMKFEAELAESDSFPGGDSYGWYNYGRAPQVIHVPGVPAVPALPALRNSHIGFLDDCDGSWFSLDEEELDDLREELEDLNEEMRDMKVHLKDELSRSIRSNRTL